MSALVDEVAALVSSNGAIFEIDRSGTWTVLVGGNSPLIVMATPDWDADDTLSIQVDHADGTVVSLVECPFPASTRSADAWWRLVRPYVEQAKSARTY